MKRGGSWMKCQWVKRISNRPVGLEPTAKGLQEFRATLWSKSFYSSIWAKVGSIRLLSGIPCIHTNVCPRELIQPTNQLFLFCFVLFHKMTIFINYFVVWTRLMLHDKTLHSTLVLCSMCIGLVLMWIGQNLQFLFHPKSLPISHVQNRSCLLTIYNRK